MILRNVRPKSGISIRTAGHLGFQYPFDSLALLANQSDYLGEGSPGAVKIREL